MDITPQDRAILRDLARQVAAIGNLPEQKERAERWTRHNDLGRGRPLVLVFPEGSWRELLPDSVLRCTGKHARGLEWRLRSKLYQWEHLRDDNVIEPLIGCGAAVHDTGWGIAEATTSSGEDRGAVHYDPVIITEADLDKIQLPTLTVDLETSRRTLAEFQELFGDLLQVELYPYPYNHMSIMDEFARWRGLDQMFMDMVDRPEWLHRAMERMLEGQIRRHEAVMASGLAALNNRSHYAGSGGNGYTRQLPGPGFAGRVRSQDLWAHATTQIFSEVSPAMHEEFALHYERRFLERFGLNCYGCCEALHHKLDQVKTIRNLRRISISPWADLARSAEGLGDRYIFSWKPNPAILASETWHPDQARAMIRRALDITRGCVVEMVMKDTHTCRNEPHRMSEWVRIALEEAERAA